MRQAVGMAEKRCVQQNRNGSFLLQVTLDGIVKSRFLSSTSTARSNLVIILESSRSARMTEVLLPLSPCTRLYRPERTWGISLFFERFHGLILYGKTESFPFYGFFTRPFQAERGRVENGERVVTGSENRAPTGWW